MAFAVALQGIALMAGHGVQPTPAMRRASRQRARIGTTDGMLQRRDGAERVRVVTL